MARGAPSWPEWSGSEGQCRLWVVWARRHAELVFPMIYTVTITHTEMHLRAEVFLNNRNESKREKGSLHGGTVGSTPGSSRCRIPFLPLTNPTDPA